MTARMGSAAGAEAKAARMSERDVGLPVWIVREEGGLGRAAGRRTRAVIVW